jgi:hypothetical protein
MRRVVTSALLLGALLAPAACGDGAEETSDTPPAVADEAAAADVGAAVPGCPFTVAQVSELIGQQMTDDGSCSFGDGKGVAGLTVTVSSAMAGETTYAYKRDLAGKSFPSVRDIGKGTKSYLAIKDIGAEAALISDKGAYTLIMSSFEFDEARYDKTMNALIDAILS